MTTCQVCPLYGRDGDQEAKPPRPPANRCDPGWSVCGYCHGRISGQLKEIPDLYMALDATPGSAPGGGRVSGTREAPLGVRVTVLDLLLPAGSGTVTDPNKDQMGNLPVAVVLDQWVSDWRDYRAQKEHRPAPTVPVLAGWLLNRLDWACQNHPAMDAFAAEIRSVAGALHSAVHGPQRKQAVHRPGVPCRRCDYMTLYTTTDGYIECRQDDCGVLMTPEEFDRWVKLCAAGRSMKDAA